MLSAGSVWQRLPVNRDVGRTLGGPRCRDVTDAFSTALPGRKEHLRSLIDQLDKFAAYLNSKTTRSVAATRSMKT
jgi:ABC-type transporter Mla subunit MlaD